MDFLLKALPLLGLIVLGAMALRQGATNRKLRAQLKYFETAQEVKNIENRVNIASDDELASISREQLRRAGVSRKN